MRVFDEARRQHRDTRTATRYHYTASKKAHRMKKAMQVMKARYEGEERELGDVPVDGGLLDEIGLVGAEGRGHHFCNEVSMDNLVGQALFGDGAAALVVGADPIQGVEKPLFRMASAAQLILPDSEGAIEGHLREVGLTFQLLNQVPTIISKNIEKSLEEAFEPLGVSDWNSLFWISHPGSPAILDAIESKLKLKPEKLRATRHVLSEYGNMSSACVFFIMDEMRKRSAEEGKATTGEGLDWEVLYGFGPGLTMDKLLSFLSLSLSLIDHLRSWSCAEVACLRSSITKSGRNGG